MNKNESFEAIAAEAADARGVEASQVGACASLQSLGGEKACHVLHALTPEEAG